MAALQGYDRGARATALREARRFLVETRHFYLDQEGFRGFLAGEQMTRTAWRMLMIIFCRMTAGNYLDEGVGQLAEVLHADYGACLRAWKTLKARGVLLEEVNDFGRVIRHRVNPAYVWRGRLWRWGEARRQYAAQQTLDSLAEELE